MGGFGIWSGGTTETTTPDTSTTTANDSRFVPIGPTITAITVSGDVEVTLDTPFGIDATGDPYHDDSGATAGEEALLVLDRATGTYSLIPWIDDTLDDTDTIADPDLGDPDFYTLTQLTIPTYDGSGQTVHPDVIKIAGGWNGWLYWMAITPYPSSDDTKENPSILVSNDGTTWQEPDGITNPVVAYPGGSSFNSDPDLVYDSTTDTLWLFYRESDGSTDDIYVTSSTDGITWATPTLLFSTPFAEALSPAVVRDGATWRMWTVNKTPSPNTMEMRSTSVPDGTWTAPTTTDAVAADGKDIWHIDIVADGSDFRAFLNVDDIDGASGDNGMIALGSSTDGLTWTTGSAVLEPAATGWTSDRLYRGSGLYEQDRWRFWVSAKSDAGEWHTGYTEIDPDDFP